MSVAEPDVLGEATELNIRIAYDPEAKTVSI
jgi:hypothetical protein